jgi:predicted enzyme related to lactoylglutathione lyase
MPPRYDFTRLLVSDFAACYRFYRDVIGLEPGFGTEEDTYADFGTRATGISLFDAAEMAKAVGTTGLPPGAARHDGFCLVFGVADVDAAWGAMTAAGGAGVAGPTDHPDWGIRTAHLRDPDGNLVEINAPL